MRCGCAGRGVADYLGEYVLAELVLGAVVRSASCRVGVPKVSYSKTFLGFQRLAGMRGTLACLLEAQVSNTLKHFVKIGHT